LESSRRRPSSLGLFVDNDDFRQPEAWQEGRLHAQLEAGQLVRQTAPTQLLDPTFFQQSVDRFITALEIAAELTNESALSQPTNPKPRANVVERLVTEMMDGVTPEYARKVGKFVELYLGSETTFRQFPCGTEHQEYALSRTLSSAPGKLQDERSALFAKYGSGAAPWTVLGQIATVTVRTSRDVVAAAADSDEGGDDADDGDADQNHRMIFERMALGLMQGLEEAGVSSAPAFPMITLTPIAIFRDVRLPARSTALVPARNQ
jgi:hypothetical protein